MMTIIKIVVKETMTRMTSVFHVEWERTIYYLIFYGYKMGGRGLQRQKTKNTQKTGRTRNGTGAPGVRMCSARSAAGACQHSGDNQEVGGLFYE